MEVPVGEECKDIAIATQLWETLLESGADRNSVLVNLGGGCVTDLGGFDTPVQVSHEEVQMAANKAQPYMTEIMREIIRRS